RVRLRRRLQIPARRARRTDRRRLLVRTETFLACCRRPAGRQNYQVLNRARVARAPGAIFQKCLAGAAGASVLGVASRNGARLTLTRLSVTIAACGLGSQR